MTTASQAAPARRRLTFARPTEVTQILPLLVVFVLCFDVPLLVALGWSFRDPKGPDPTLRHYVDFVTSHLYLPIVWRTALLALIVTAVCAVLGYPLALWISRLSAGRQLVAICLVIVPFWISILVRTYSWIVILGNAGIVNRTLKGLGLIEASIPFLYNELGVAIGMVNVLLPFLVLPLYAAMVRVDPRLLHVAATLGASARATFWRVYFPITVPALSAAMALVFILSLGFYITPAILGGGKVPLIANMMDLLINRLPRWELASAVSMTLLLATLLVYAGYQWLRARTPA